MSISDKLATVAEKTPKVYDAGFTKGYDSGYEAGQKSEYDRFWDNYQNYGNRKSYNYAFAGSGWTGELFKPKYPLNCTGQSNGIFQTNTAITAINIPLLFDYAGCVGAFDWCMNLKTIASITVTDKVSFSNWFTQCGELQTINFTEDSVIANSIAFTSCKKLNKDSIISIINALSNTVSGKTLTLSKSAVDTAFQELDKADDGSINWYMPGSESSEWSALIATKSNWTISLV